MMARGKSLMQSRLTGFTVLLSCALWAGVVEAQSRPRLADVNERLVRVERVLDQSLLGMLQQIEALSREIRLLSGELESQANELAILRKRNRELYADTDNRIAVLEDRVRALQSNGVPGEGENGDGTDGAASDSSSLNDGDNQAVFVPSDETNNTQINVARLPDGVVPQVKIASAAEKAQYTEAYDLVNDGFFDEAVQRFTRFLDAYPDGAYADNAWYWQGEALYAQRLFDKAVVNFNVVADSFPDSRKAPDAQLKVAYALYEQSRYTESKTRLNQLRDGYPGTAAALLARKRLVEMQEAGL